MLYSDIMKKFLIFLVINFAFVRCVVLNQKSHGNKASNESQFCVSKLCILDSNRLLESATDNKTVKPCDDFKEFSMGKFIKFRALSDRYDQSGIKIK